MAMVSREGSGESANPNSSTGNTWHRVRILAKGANVTVWRGEGDDGPMAQVLNTTSAPTMTPASMWFISGAGAAFAYDDIEVVADGWTSDTTFATNGGNELTSSTFGGVTTTCGYDAWGRMTSKMRGSYAATYGWHYGGKLTSVTSTLPGEGTVTYAYGGDGKRRERDDGTTVTWYNWDIGWNLLNEEDDSGALTTTFVHAPQGPVGPVLADVAGSNPASGAYRYYTLDYLGSTNGLYDGAKAKVSSLAYMPYGAAYSDVGPGPLPRYTGHLWDGAAGLHLAPYRAYAPTLARWLSRDPLGMVDGPNVYGYSVNNPIRYSDSLGLAQGVCTGGDFASTAWSCFSCARGIYGGIGKCSACAACLAVPNPACVWPCVLCVKSFWTAPLSCGMCLAKIIWMSSGCCGSRPSIAGDMLDLLNWF